MGRLSLLVLLVLALLAGAAAAAPAGSPGIGAAVAHPEPGDADGDGVRDEYDNCVQTKNGDQANADRDRLGDRCDGDADGDGVANPLPYPQPTQAGHDNCPLVPNPDQAKAAANPKYGEACYVDSDGDTDPDPLDNCPGTFNADQADYDYDRTGDVCDPDDDEDGEFDAVDNCRLTYNYDQADADGDGIGSACDASEVVPGAPGPAGPAPAVDTTAPVVKVTVARTHRVRRLRGRVPVRVRCSEACAVVAALTVDRRTARRLRIGRRAMTVARGTATLAGAGSTYVFLRVKRPVARRLPVRPTVRSRLAVTAADRAGNARRVGRALRLGR
jgi:hypothetical protein